MEVLRPILVSHLFPLLDKKLIELLKALSDSDWSLMALPKWTVKDIAAHLLDGNMRRLSMGRDGFWGEKFSESSGSIQEFLNGLNHDWVKACRRLSPRMLIELLEVTGR